MGRRLRWRVAQAVLIVSGSYHARRTAESGAVVNLLGHERFSTRRLRSTDVLFHSGQLTLLTHLRTANRCTNMEQLTSMKAGTRTVSTSSQNLETAREPELCRLARSIQISIKGVPCSHLVTA